MSTDQEPKGKTPKAASPCFFYFKFLLKFQRVNLQCSISSRCTDTSYDTHLLVTSALPSPSTPLLLGELPPSRSVVDRPRRETVTTVA